ncbi:hypothetical protein LMCDFJHI_03887 [Aeromonas salmonicida]
MLYQSLTKLDALSGQHITQAGHGLLQHFASLPMLHHKVHVGLVVGSHLDLDFHLAKTQGIELDLRLLQLVRQHQVYLLMQLGRGLRTGQLEVSQMLGIPPRRYVGGRLAVIVHGLGLTVLLHLLAVVVVLGSRLCAQSAVSAKLGHLLLHIQFDVRLGIGRITGFHLLETGRQGVQ